MVGESETLAGLLDDYELECARSREVAAGLELGVMAKDPANQRSVRWVLTHMIEETARHNGQLDLIRELLDGATGYLPGD